MLFYANESKPVSTLGGRNAELLIIKSGGTYIYQWTLKC
jgi:hypothetical protein